MRRKQRRCGEVVSVARICGGVPKPPPECNTASFLSLDASQFSPSRLQIVLRSRLAVAADSPAVR